MGRVTHVRPGCGLDRLHTRLDEERAAAYIVAPPTAGSALIVRQEWLYGEIDAGECRSHGPIPLELQEPPSPSPLPHGR
jgi:hypothetical protein